MALSRRKLLTGAAAMGALLRPLRLTATPSVAESEPSSEGPFYKPGAPFRSVFEEPGLHGTPLVLTGRVFSTSGQPLSHALLDIWHANDAGEYDNTGFRLRGRLYTAADGSYSLKSIVPKSYMAGSSLRAAHIHLKLSAAGFPLLTTEIYFKGNPDNYQDGLVKPSLIVKVRETGGGKAGQFDFVLKPA